jgi:hypothetical protein
MGRDFLMHARTGMLRALNRNVERVSDRSGKDTRGGKAQIKARRMISASQAETITVSAAQHFQFPSVDPTFRSRAAIQLPPMVFG